ncbi:pericentrin isoform X3 [Erythrolamprus reginae]|uniref:pericentrin isoform X3 n=1 Tax=Erythrolamprus reginae TaxID=121349 RepID=UPI00396C56AB
MEGEAPARVPEAAGSLPAPPEVQEQGQNYDIEEFFKRQDENKNLHAKLMEEQKQLLEDLQQKVEATLQRQPEVPDNLKLEAIRLSSNNICTSQMELMQMNLIKEKETALMELREILNDKHAQEIAVLQSRYYFELEHVNKQNQKEKEEMVLKHQLDMDEMKEKISLEMEEKHLHILENLKKEWALNVDVSLKNVSEELSVKQTELNKLKQNITAETEEFKKKMETLSLEKRQAEMEHKNLENKYHLAMKTLQSKHEKEMQDIKEQNKKQIEELQQEIQKLKAESEEEMAQLWSQLDGARASRQELSELKIQLLARTSHVEELEYLKKDYQLKWDKKKTEHETELEQLRLYFEQKLKSLEENYREELTMLHQRLQEVKDYSIEEMEKSQEQDMEFGPSVTLLDEMTERERLDLFEQLTQQLEHYKEELCSLQLRLDKKHLHEIELLRSTLTLQYQENIIKLKLELSDQYTSEIEQLKKKHCLHLEQLHAKISEEHLKEIAKIHQQSTQDAARQIETEVAQRLLLLENDYKNDLSCLQLEMQSISSQHEEIEELKRKNTELKEIGIVQEKNVKEELEQEELTVAPETQRHTFENGHYEDLDILQKTILQMEEEHKRTIQGFQNLHLVEIEKGKEKIQQLQKELKKIKSEKKQLEKEINFLRKEMEKGNIEFKKYPEEQENQEENILIAMLRSDSDSYRNERDKLQESCQQALKLLLKMVKSTKNMEDLICKKIGLCLDDSLASEESQEIISEEIVLARPLKTIEQWKFKKNNRICQGEVPDQTLLEHSLDSLELSEHLCESIFENPSLIFENEERIKKISRCLYIAVEKLLDMLAESTRQLEEMHNIHSNIKEECKNKNWEACQILNEQHESMDCFNEESKVQNQLVLELHKAKGLIEGYLTERHTLEEALNLKEESEHRLVAEVEKLKAQIQKLTQQNARFAKEQKLLISQKRALAANVGEREDELIKEIERLAKTNLELQCQAEKDCSNLNAQMKILEIELEDQLNKNQNLAAMASEVIDLRQQMEALERQLKNQRDFMDKQAIEREHERDEFQEEIHKLEMELKFTTKSQTSEKSRTYLVESLHNEIKERVDDYNRLFTEKEQIEKLLTARNEEIEKLEGQISLNKEVAKNVEKLMQELEKMKKKEIELKEDKETLQQQHNKNLILISTLQSKLDEVRHRIFTDTNEDHMLKEQLKIQEELTTTKREVADLVEQLEQFKDNLMNKNEENVQLKSKLEVEKNANINKLIELKGENAHLKENIEKLARQCQNPDENELVILQFLKSLLEEKNQETDHLNEQIERLEQKVESSKENEVLEKQMLETKVMKSTIEELRADKEHLLKNKAEEIEELHKVIKKLQKESGAFIPIYHETENEQGNPIFSLEESEENLDNKFKEGSQSLLKNEKGDDSQNELQRQLEMSLIDKETLQQQLNTKETQFKMEFKILQQNLENVQESSRQHYSELTSLQLLYKELQEQHMLLKVYVIQKEDEMKEMNSCSQDLEVHRREREMKLLETELQLQIVSEQNVEQAAKVQHMTENIVKLENELKIMTQALHNNEPTYQSKISELQVTVAELKAEIGKKVEELELLKSEKDLFHSQLKIPMENDQDNYQKKIVCPKILDVEAFFPCEEKEKGGEERDLSNMLSASADFSFSPEEDNMTNLQISSRNPNIYNKQLQDIPFIQRKQTNCNEVQQNLKLLCKNMWQSNQDSQNSQVSQTIPNCFQNIIMNNTLWDSPENMRKENENLEFQASLSLTPFPEVDVVHSIAFESLCSENSVIQEDTSGGLECPISYSNSNEDAAAKPHFLSSVFLEPISSVNKCSGLQENVSVNNAEVFSLIPPELQDDLKVTMSRFQTASTEYGSNTSLDLILQLNQAEPKDKACQNSNIMAPLQCFGMTPDVTTPTVKETEMMSEQLKTVLKMVYDESYKILLLSEKSLPLDDGDKIQQGPSVEGWQRERLILVDIIQSLKNYLKQSNKERKGEQQPKIVMEHFSSSDGNSLLSDMQDLEVQLRFTQLQSQEKLQELQETLINSENRGKKQEQQLQRQVELLEYKFQQQQSIANDLQASLKHEQEKASEMHELLKQEHTAILNLKSDLCDSKQTNERLEKSLQKTQNEIIKYSSALENKERSITTALENLQREHLKNEELQIKLDEQQKQHKIKEDEKSKAIEELQAALELQCIQNNQLTVALEHEQSANSNLRKELQIEHSRYEALLSKDQNKLLELQKNLDIEKKQNADMLTALKHERVLTEHLTMKLNECGSCKHKDSLQELQVQLHLERSNSMKLLAIIEKSQQQIFDSKKQMEEMHLHCKDLQQEHALQNTVQDTGSMMQNKKQDVLEIQREKEAQMKMGWKQLQSTVKSTRDQETIQGERKMAQEQQPECHCLRALLEAQENQNESRLQYLHNCVRFKELQQMLEDLKNQEILLKKYNQFPSKNNYTNLTFTTDTVRLHVEQQILENIREQLVLVAAYLSEFIYKTIDKTVNWSASNDEIVAALLHILEIKELLASSKPVVIPTSIIHSMQTSEGYIYQDKRDLQVGVKATNYTATKTNVPENKQTVMSSSPKIQKLYRKYLRAESFRKALVYQKKYLLLLLGGFQECEQATLSLIARMGIYPSPPDLNVSETRSRFFTKFRSAVRVVIAILRLKFLVRKWHKVNKKEMPLEAISSSLGRNSDPVASLEVLKQQQPFPNYAAPEGENCNRNNLMRLASCTVKSLHHLHNRSTSFMSQTSSKDPEDSLTEYIAHLEAIQDRLGILLPGINKSTEKDRKCISITQSGFGLLFHIVILTSTMPARKSVFAKRLQCL